MSKTHQTSFITCSNSMCMCYFGVVFLTGDWRLFCVRGEAEMEGSLVEVECCCASLRSRASLLLLGVQKGQLYLWHGCKSHPGARKVGKRTVERLTQM